MRRNNKVITISVDGEANTHIVFEDLGFATLCGQDGNDPGIDMHLVKNETPDKAKVDCEQCWLIWKACKDWKASDFRNQL